MGCLSLNISPVAPASLSATPQRSVNLSATPQHGATLSAIPQRGAMAGAAASVALSGGAKLTVGEVCSVSAGELTVLAASDGPLRTKDGGYILLDPDLE